MTAKPEDASLQGQPFSGEDPGMRASKLAGPVEPPVSANIGSGLGKEEQSILEAVWAKISLPPPESASPTMAGLFGNLTGHSSAGLSSPLDAEDARDAWHRFYGDPSTGAAAEDPKGLVPLDTIASAAAFHALRTTTPHERTKTTAELRKVVEGAVRESSKLVERFHDKIENPGSLPPLKVKEKVAESAAWTAVGILNGEVGGS